MNTTKSMMTSKEIRQAYLDFFKSKQHHIVSSAPMVIKNDPTLMFTNAGMNQFKDIFLGDKPVQFPRIADTQKCLRVSGKHNDLEEVGIDTYHHTMFEMLGNWSFGDYFKKESIDWAWELLTRIYKIDKDRMYVTIFEGDTKEKLERDHEAYTYWKNHIDESRILNGNKKDNFWEMGDTGPCGPCSEIHVDIRSDEDRKKVDGKTLVNASHPEVIEIWNLVFMQFNRMADGSLVKLPAQHVDTGMGFERLTRVVQNKRSNYDTDIFKPLIRFIESRCQLAYGVTEQTDIAMRVMADHIRAISFAIADGQLPSNTGAGYVIRRILRRAVRYAYSYLNFNKPILHDLMLVLAEQMQHVFPELHQQKDFVQRVIQEEEQSFLHTLESGLRRLKLIEQDLAATGSKQIDGAVAFELYDTYGFPIDLTHLIARERGLTVDEAGFHSEMQKQKERSRKAATVSSDDWIQVADQQTVLFTGYDEMQTESRIVKYRKQKIKDKEQYQIVFACTPFYAESGGQIGDTGTAVFGEETIRINDTKKENDLIVHYTTALPSDVTAYAALRVDESRRRSIMNNHSATHLLHAALRRVLGTHVEQKGSLVADDYLRFDFSHFAKLTDEQLAEIEALVNEKIRANIPLVEQRNVPVDQALKQGAMALFGEKYGDQVRVITFDKQYSVELCGGTHVSNTGVIGYFKVTSESAVAAGVRRIEALTGEAAQQKITAAFTLLQQLNETLKNPKDLLKSISALQDDLSTLRKEVEHLQQLQVNVLKDRLKQQIKNHNGIQVIIAETTLNSADALKKLAFDLRNEVPDLFFVASALVGGKPQLCVMISDNLVKEKNLNAGTIIKSISKAIKGGGGGQAFFATAGGTDISGIKQALQQAQESIG
jgi:alanyl-tRNA synthetase